MARRLQRLDILVSREERKTESERRTASSFNARRKWKNEKRKNRIKKSWTVFWGKKLFQTRKEGKEYKFSLLFSDQEILPSLLQSFILKTTAVVFERC